MRCRRSGEFVITWLWNRGNSASPCKTQFRVVGRHFASHKFTKTHSVTVVQRNEYSRMYTSTSKIKWKCTDLCGEIGSLQKETLTGFQHEIEKLILEQMGGLKWQVAMSTWQEPTGRDKEMSMQHSSWGNKKQMENMFNVKKYQKVNWVRDEKVLFWISK